MGTKVESNNEYVYTDVSEKFKEGMTREEAQKMRGSIFNRNKYSKEFFRIDKDFDGVLSKDEITDELHKNISDNEDDCFSDIIWATWFGVYSYMDRIKYPIKSKLWLAAGIIPIYNAAKHLYNNSKLKERIANGHN